LNADLLALQTRLGYRFTSLPLLARALTHRSHTDESYERLEFLGDSVLGFVVADHVYRAETNFSEGRLAKLRAAVVNARALADVAREIGLGQHIKLGRGEETTGGRDKASILSDTVEAVIGAIYLDTDLERVRSLLLGWYASRLGEIKPGIANKDPKTRLQEILQGSRKSLPTYTVTNVKGEAHNQEFTVQCEVDGLDGPLVGIGSSRRKAEQAAAQQALERLS